MHLAMVDALLIEAKCGEESENVNNFVNAEIEIKKLRFHVPDRNGKSKCNKLHIGKKKVECHHLNVHGSLMGEVESDEYLGDIIANNGKNTRNIQTRVAKGLGIVSHIIDLLKNVSFGKHFCEIARTLRDS